MGMGDPLPVSMGEKLRSEAREMRDAAGQVLKAADNTGVKAALATLLTINDLDKLKSEIGALVTRIPDANAIRRQATVTTATVSANVFDALADFYDYLSVAGPLTESRKQRDKIAQRNHAMRVAAARGDWDAVTGIARGDVDPTGEGGSGGDANGDVG